MVDIVDARVGEPKDPALRAVLKRTVREFELAAEKVAANAAEPAAFPLPEEPGSIEQVLAGRFRKLSPTDRKAAGIAVAKRVKAPAAVQQRRLQELADVDLAKPTAIEKQVSALSHPAALKLTRAQLVAEAAAAGAKVVPNAATPPTAAAQRLTKLELRIHKVRCDDETNGFLGSEAGSDEIDLGGTSVDESGDTHKVSPFRVASFDDGDQKVFSPPRRFTFFNLTEGTEFPKAYVGALVLAEIDSGGFNDFLKKLMEKVRERVITALTTAIGGAIGASGGPIGVVIGLAVGWVVGKVFDLIANIWNDDVFTPIRVSISIPSLTARWPGGRTDGPERTVTVKGHGGQYSVTYDWRLFA
jgi:hypothetical protein